MRKIGIYGAACALVTLGAFLPPMPARAHHTAEHAPAVLLEIGIDQKLNAELPLDLPFREETGSPVRLRRYFGEQPVLLALVYYECPRLCPLVLSGLLRSLQVLAFTAGEDFRVLVVSFDPAETPALAAAKKATILAQYGRPGAAAGWHFLTGEAPAIQQLTRAVGFRYAEDPPVGQYAHAAGLILLTPQGRVARYFPGLEVAPRDLRLGLVEASAHRIGSPVDQVLLYCFRYDPATGRYGLIIMNVLRLAGGVTVLILGTFIMTMTRRDRRKGQIIARPR
jgi:protein SCO1